CSGCPLDSEPCKRDPGTRLRTWLLNTPRYSKRAILVATDFALLSFALWASLSLRFGTLYVPKSQTALALLIAAPLICIATLWRFEVYKVVTRFMSYR